MSNDIAQNDFLGRGWSFPPDFTGGQNVQMTSGVADIEASLQVLLSTRQGERVMEPKYGCNLDAYLFESLTAAMRTLIEDLVRTAIVFFEPRIDVKTVTLDASREDAGLVLIEIDYVVRATNSRLNFVYPYYLNEGTELSLLTTSEPATQ